MKYCDDYAALLDLYVDGELSPEEMSRIQEHLEQCPGCRAYVDDALAIRAAFPDVEDVEVPAGFAEGVMARIQTEAGSKKKQSTPWRKVLPTLAACCALVILLQKEEIVSNMYEAYRRLAANQPDYAYGVFMSGPSKTADIEQALVFGAHGPMRVTVILTD